MYACTPTFVPNLGIGVSPAPVTLGAVSDTAVSVLGYAAAVAAGVAIGVLIAELLCKRDSKQLRREDADREWNLGYDFGQEKGYEEGYAQGKDDEKWGKTTYVAWAPRGARR